MAVVVELKVCHRCTTVSDKYILASMRRTSLRKLLLLPITISLLSTLLKRCNLICDVATSQPAEGVLAPIQLEQPLIKESGGSLHRVRF